MIKAATRRTMLKGTTIAALGTTLPVGAVLAQNAPTAAAKGPKLLEMDGKAKLVVLGDRPLVAETPSEMLDDDVTPTDKLFVRNNGQVPEMPADLKGWKIKIDGEVNTPTDIALGDLMSKFENVTLQLMLECGGNGRSFFSPEARGNQWTNGGVGCPQWTGVRLADVLKAAGVKPGAIYTGHYGADPTLAGETDKPTLSRGMRLEKAMDPHTLIAFKLNGKDIPLAHGAPVRLVVPGWAGSLSIKWLKRIWVRDKEHDGPGMGGFSYRTPRTPIVPGSKGNEKDMAILESMPVRSIITYRPMARSSRPARASSSCAAMPGRATTT
ncbi:hypothetical protein BH10PSE6_BH10PSE6_10940 [soil metagenome]